MESLSADSTLGSLAQAARGKQVKSARRILIAIGVLTIVGNLAMAMMAENTVDAEINKAVQQGQLQGLDIDQQKLAEIRAQAIKATQLASYLFAGLGLSLWCWGSW